VKFLNVFQRELFHCEFLIIENTLKSENRSPFCWLDLLAYTLFIVAN